MYKSNYKRYRKQKRVRVYKKVIIMLILFIIGFGIAFFATSDDITFSSIGVMLGFDDKENEKDPDNGGIDVDLEFVKPIDPIEPEDVKDPVSPQDKIDINGKYIDISKVNDTNYVNEILLAIEQKTINSVVIPLKNADGSFNYISKVPYTTATLLNIDLTEFINTLKQTEVYLIADVSMYNDNNYAKTYSEDAVKTKSGVTFYDYSNSRWISPYAIKGNDYLKAVLVEIEGLGFDEIMMSNFAFPFEGKLDLVSYGETEVLKEDILSVRAKEFKSAVPNTKLSVQLTDKAMLDTNKSYENIDKLSPNLDMIYLNYVDETTKSQVSHLTNIGFISSDIDFKGHNYIIK